MTPCRLRTYLILALVTIGLGCGCGFDRLQQQTLPDEVTGLTLEQLEDIQDDETLTDDEKKEEIRTAIGAPEDSSGDRLVDFLFNLNVP
ncbi:MAG TPA: hypothetical protein VJZ71_07005 [Phycisphaerae bacterium]|nr:hypothetical protein [Phycisphaerae bacterium]